MGMLVAIDRLYPRKLWRLGVGGSGGLVLVSGSGKKYGSISHDTGIPLDSTMILSILWSFLYISVCAL
jgi:hypothetical protein